MKINHLLISLSFVVICLACNPNEPDPVLSVDWAASEQVDKSQSMTLVIKPDGPMMQVADTTNDVVGVFMGDECMAVAHPKKLNIGYRVYFLINAPLDMTSQVVSLTFQYFSANQKRILKTEQAITYETDYMLGSTDDPYVILFE